MFKYAFSGAFGLSFMFIFIMVFLLLMFLAGFVVLIIGLVLNRFKSFKKAEGSRSLRRVFIALGTALCVPLPLLFSIFYFFSLYKENEERQEMGDLIYAIDHSNERMLERKIRNDKPVNSEFIYYGSITTPLIEACESGSPEFVQLLLENGADPELQVSDTGINPLWAAISVNSPDIIKLLLDAGADAAWERDGESLLHVALYFENDPEVFSLLLDAGADVNNRSPDDEERTVLMSLVNKSESYKTTKGREWILSLLSIFSEYHADLFYLMDKQGKTGWDYVMESSDDEIREQIRILFPK